MNDRQEDPMRDWLQGVEHLKWPLIIILILIVLLVVFIDLSFPNP